MIESRYSIEYIDPNSGRNPSKLGKILIYSVLTISIITAIVALIFSNLPTNTSQDVTAKAQSFIRSFSTVSIPAPANEEEIPTLRASTAVISTKHMQSELTQQKIIASQRESDLKEEIERLSQENSAQHNEAVKQLQTNRTLKEKIEQLSKQLENEELKHSQLVDKVTSLSEKNKSVSALLKEKTQTIDGYANEIKNLETKQTAVIETVAPSVSVNSPDTPKVVEKLEGKVGEDSIVNKITKNIIEIEEEKPKISQMDAIIAAMEAENNSSTIKNTKEVNSNEKN